MIEVYIISHLSLACNHVNPRAPTVMPGFSIGEKMPYRPKKPCAYPGCPRLTDGKYCEEHQKLMQKEYNQTRPTQGFYNSKEWRKKRADFLIDHPFCVECYRHGRLSKATIVDHIIPIRQGGLALEDSNLQALCWSCHSRKSIEEGSRFGKR